MIRGPDPSVRPAEDADRARLIAILNATWEANWAPFMPAEADARWHDLGVARRFIDQVWALCTVATIDGAVMGFLHAASDEVKSLHVDPAAKRRGIGRALMAAAEAQLRQRGYVRVRVETEAFNRPAQDFYRALGYVETRRFEDDVIGFQVPCVEFRKSLGPVPVTSPVPTTR